MCNKLEPLTADKPVRHVAAIQYPWLIYFAQNLVGGFAF